ncbi:hypothetical protein [Nostoc sphaeroides]|uniref:Uncharacterized protein n=1 Tax=Nostoc sphaeroides CCNUC1 TaxID=2653204 RepID=A0A5P8VZM8_9NOSO|nr:hypothetical protein [Nostoc sphaeroides]QFS45903.1 hypothetical protein GXM_03382 [Nostoc sphaeroides CCNUC1]
MIAVVLASSFKRAFKRLVRRQPELQERIGDRLAKSKRSPTSDRRQCGMNFWMMTN